MSEKEPYIIIGAGPAGLMAAQHLAEKGLPVIVFEQNKAAARKFLVAGHGGFNLTHSEPFEQFQSRYSVQKFAEILQQFDHHETRKWLKNIGIETFVGSSGKIFPIKTIKPIQVLNAWLAHLEKLNVDIHYQHRFIDFDEKKVTIENQRSEIITFSYKKIIFSTGGLSWPQTGSDGKWQKVFLDKNIDFTPFESANSGYETSDSFGEYEGQVLKNITVRFGNIIKKGEITFTHYGIEGAPLYYMNRYTRDQSFPLKIYINLKPLLNIEVSLALLQKSNNISQTLKKDLKCNDLILSLLKKLPKHEYLDPEKLIIRIQNYPIEVTGLRPIQEVISSAGGISWEALNDDLSLKVNENIYCIGEMVDWEAPTGGYLLQGCFSMGAFVANQIANKISK